MEPIRQALMLAGRVLLAALFVLAGFDHLGDYASTQQWLLEHGLAAGWLPLVIALELGAGIALGVGWQTRRAAVLLATLSLVVGLRVHGLDDPLQELLLMHNLAIAGGLLILGAQEPGRFSVDAARERALA